MRYGIAYLVTRTTLLPLVVLIYPLPVLFCSLVVFIFSLVILVCQPIVLVCPFVCLLVVLVVLSVDYTYEYYIKVQSIILFKQPQVFRYTLYLHDVQKLVSVPYSSLSN